MQIDFIDNLPTLIRAWYSSFSLCTQMSFSRGPARICSNGRLLSVFLVLSSTIVLVYFLFFKCTVNKNNY